MEHDMRVLAPQRGEERRAYNMIPMRVRNEYVNRIRQRTSNQLVAEYANARARVEHDDAAVGCSNFDTDRVAAVTHRRGPRRRDRPAHAIERHAHRGPPANSLFAIQSELPVPPSDEYFTH